MSRISDVLIDIEEHFDENLTDEQIAEKVGCPVSWVKDARSQAFYEDNFAPEENFF